jgi:hypothetical protein
MGKDSKRPTVQSVSSNEHRPQRQVSFTISSQVLVNAIILLTETLRFRNAFPEKYDMYGYSPRSKKKSNIRAKAITTTWGSLTQQTKSGDVVAAQVPQMRSQRNNDYTEEDVSVIYRASYIPERDLATAQPDQDHSTGFRHLIQRPESSWMAEESGNPTLSYPSLADDEYAPTVAPADTSSMADHVAHIAQQQPEANIELIRSISDMRKR